MRLVVALGGNALLRRGEPMDVETQRRHVHQAALALAPLAAEHTLVVTHGNGPQVGLLALQAEAYRGVHPYPLDVLGAESEGMIGYLIEQELAGLLQGRDVATLLTQVEVDAADPSFAAPTKPIGPLYEEVEARRLALERGWAVARDGRGWRRVVPSPAPRRILEMRAIRRLLDVGVVVICAGGGGVPVCVSASGAVHGVEAVVDKDRAAALLAEGVEADRMVLLTDVPGVYRGWGGRAPELVRQATPPELAAITVDVGSMGPKVEAVCRFVRHTGRTAAIGALDAAVAVVRGESGTQVAPEGTSR